MPKAISCAHEYVLNNILYSTSELYPWAYGGMNLMVIKEVIICEFECIFCNHTTTKEIVQH